MLAGWKRVEGASGHARVHEGDDVDVGVVRCRGEKLQQLQAEGLAFVYVQALFLLAERMQGFMCHAGSLHALLIRECALHEVCCHALGAIANCLAFSHGHVAVLAVGSSQTKAAEPWRARGLIAEASACSSCGVYGGAGLGLCISFALEHVYAMLAWGVLARVCEVVARWAVGGDDPGPIKIEALRAEGYAVVRWAPDACKQ